MNVLICLVLTGDCFSSMFLIIFSALLFLIDGSSYLDEDEGAFSVAGAIEIPSSAIGLGVQCVGCSS